MLARCLWSHPPLRASTAGALARVDDRRTMWGCSPSASHMVGRVTARGSPCTSTTTAQPDPAPRRPSTVSAALRPLAPHTPAPGNVAAPVRYRPVHGRLVAGELGVAVAAAPRAVRRRSWWRGRAGGGTRARSDRGSSPASRRVLSRKPGCGERRELVEPAPRFGAVGQPPGRPYGVYEALEAEHVAAGGGHASGRARSGR